MHNNLDPVACKLLPADGEVKSWLLAQPETAAIFAEHATARQKAVYDFTDYGSGFLARSRELFEREMQYYPESILFIKPLAERLFK